MATTIEVFTVEETGSDYVVLRDASRSVRVNFADDGEFTKESSADFFRPLKGKPAALPVDGPFFLAVDFWRGSDNNLRVMPFPFAVSSVEHL